MGYNFFVSIHAFRGEGDCGAGAADAMRLLGFQSTPSGGKATGKRRGQRGPGVVSIHAFRGEGDPPR